MLATARAARSEEAGRLAELYRSAVSELSGLRGGRALIGLHSRPEPVDQSFLAQLADEGTLTLTGCLGEVVVGYATCRLKLLGDGGRLGAIEELYVVPEQRRLGVGRAMATEMVEWCAAHECCGVDAYALPGSRAVKSFFEAGQFTARLLVMHRKM